MIFFGGVRVRTPDLIYINYALSLSSELNLWGNTYYDIKIADYALGLVRVTWLDLVRVSYMTSPNF